MCASCGRAFHWRRRWAKTWHRVRYCSDACRRTKVGRGGRELERAILDLLAARGPGATICPSEAARRVVGEDWRASMESARRAARRLVARGHLEITQAGRVVDPTSAVGPIRLRRAP